MDEVDLHADIPAEANAIEILVTTEPANGSVEVYRGIDDPQPIVMTDGAHTILGAPESRRLYVRALEPTETYEIFILRWLI